MKNFVNVVADAVFAIGSKLKIPPPELFITTTTTGGCPTLRKTQKRSNHSEEHHLKEISSNSRIVCIMKKREIP